HIQINTNSNVDGNEQFAEQAKSLITNALGRFDNIISRIEVHLSDENSDKGGPNDKRCLLEARIKGRQPIAVTHSDASLEQAIRGAATKMKNAIENVVG